MFDEILSSNSVWYCSLIQICDFCLVFSFI